MSERQRINSVIIHIASVMWFPELNLARKTKNYGNEKERQELIDSMVAEGVKIDDNGMAIVEDIKPELLERAMSERQNVWDGLKANVKVNPSTSIDLQVWEEIYTLNNKLRPILYTGVTWNRRSSVYFSAMVARRKSATSEHPLPITTDLAASIQSFATPWDRLTAQIM